MVHKAFREALGETATQAGSENSPGRFRFDFSASGAVPESAMVDVEARVNDLVMADLGVHAEIMTQEEAVRSGAMALFGEKYGDEVRVISVGDWARELCGGTHAQRSGQLGVVKLLGESSIGSGVRRVEALVGGDAYRFLAREHLLVAQLSEALKVRPEQLPERVNDIVDRLRAAEKEIEKVRLQQLLASAGQLVAQAEDIGGVSFVGARGRRRRPAATSARSPWTSAASCRRTVLVSPRSSARPTASRLSWSRVNEAARGPGFSANTLVRAASEVLGGKGGGKDDVAQGGGADASKTGEALSAIRRVLAEGRPCPPWRPSWPAYASGWIPATPASGSRAATPRASGHPGGDRDAGCGATSTGSPPWSTSSVRCASTSGLPRSMSGERARRPVRFERSRVSWRLDWPRSRSGCATSA